MLAKRQECCSPWSGEENMVLKKIILSKEYLSTSGFLRTCSLEINSDVLTWNVEDVIWISERIFCRWIAAASASHCRPYYVCSQFTLFHTRIYISWNIWAVTGKSLHKTTLVEAPLQAKYMTPWVQALKCVFTARKQSLKGFWICMSLHVRFEISHR